MKKEAISVSHSALEKYETCPRYYKYHYIDRIRSTRGSSALFFGTAIDEALNELLESKDLLKCLKVYDAYMVLWREKFNVDFFKNDFDKIVLKNEDTKYIDSLPPEKQSHYFGWYSLYRKGVMLLEKYEKEILPKIKEVVSVQQKIEKVNQYGDKYIGYSDVTLLWDTGSDTLPPVVCLFDHKTSSSSYPKSKLKNSRQLGFYAWALGYKTKGYIVLRKDLSAKGLLRPIQVIFDEFDQEFVDKELIKMDTIIQSIKDKKFPKTEQKWQCKKMYGKPCMYYGICKEGLEVSQCGNLIKK